MTAGPEFLSDTCYRAINYAIVRLLAATTETNRKGGVSVSCLSPLSSTTTWLARHFFGRASEVTAPESGDFVTRM